MSLRDNAIADILAATSPEVLGQNIVVDGVALSAVVKSLTHEEVTAIGFDGISIQGTRLTLSAATLGFVPVHGQRLDVDGVVWNTLAVIRNGDRLRITLTRYVS